MITMATMWDDGLVSDLILMDFLRKVNGTAAFAISPGRHAAARVPNDTRGNYGTLVSVSELLEFADFEICNHTLNHRDVTKCSPSELEYELTAGRSLLEDTFQRNIDGFCYPYGANSPEAVQALLRQNCRYARTTKQTTIKNSNPLLLPVTAKWDVDIDTLLREADCEKSIILWGHTYELSDESKWSKVQYMYSRALSDPLVKLVSFNELMEYFYEGDGRVRIL